MDVISELGQQVRMRRADMGLTQAMVARMSGLSRSTINQVETGSIQDLSLTRTAKLLASLGLSMSFSPARKASSGFCSSPSSNKPRMSALQRATQSASVSYQTALPVDVLEESLAQAKAPGRFAHHVNEVLESASVALLADIVHEVYEARGLEPRRIWSHMRSLAKDLGTSRDLWG